MCDIGEKNEMSRERREAIDAMLGMYCRSCRLRDKAALFKTRRRVTSP